MGSQLRLLGLVLLLPLIAACTTPDLKPWAESTSTITSTVKADQDAYATFVRDTVSTAKTYTPRAKQINDWEDRAHKFEKWAKQVAALMDLVENYSTALTDLAAAGEEGPAAAQSVIDSVNKGAQLANFAAPGSDIVSKAVKKVVTKVFELYQQADAQKRLAAVMQLAQYGPADGDGTGFVPTVATSLREIYSLDSTSQIPVHGTLVTTAVNQADIIYRGKYGSEKIDFYRNYRNSLPELYKAASYCLQNKSFPCEKAQQLMLPESLTPYLASAKEAFGMYVADVKAAEQFKLERSKQARKLVKAVDAWADQHKKLADALKKCGGWNAVSDRSCGNWSFEGLKAAAKALKP